MDSITQAALGAAVGEAVLGRRLGNRALLIGAVAGTLPDLDIIASPFLDSFERLGAHRGFTHSLLFIGLCTALGARFSAPLARGREFVEPKLWAWFWFLAISTHILIDMFTAYGTQVLWPFSDARLALDNLFIIDPLYTLPLLLGLILTVVLSRSRRYRRWNLAGLLLSSTYVLFSFSAKHLATDQFQQALTERGERDYTLYTLPTQFNTLLWRAVVKVEDGYLQGWYSLLSPTREIAFLFTPDNADMLSGHRDHPVIQRISWITGGFMRVESDGDALIIRDMRYGQVLNWAGGAYVFSYRVPHSTLARQEPPFEVEMLRPTIDSRLARQNLREEFIPRMLGRTDKD